MNSPTQYLGFRPVSRMTDHHQAVLDESSSAVSDFLSRLPEDTEGAAVATKPLADQVAMLEAKNEGFVVPTQVSFCGCSVLEKEFYDRGSAHGVRGNIGGSG